MATLRLNVFFNVLLNLSRVVFPLVTAPYVARVLGPDSIGLYNFSNSYAAYFAMFAFLGIPTHAMREVAKARDNRENLSRVVSEFVSLTLILTAAVSLVYILSLLFVGQLNRNVLVFLLSGSVLYMTPFRVEWYFSGTEKFGFITLRQVLIKVLSIAALFLFVHEKSDLMIYVVITALGNFIGDGWYYLTMRSEGVKVRLTTVGLKKHIRPAAVLFASSVAISVYTALDTLMLGFLNEYSEVAYYNSATNISRSLLAVVTSVSTVAIPRISYYLENGAMKEINNIITKSFALISFLVFPASVGLCCISPVFTPLFYGDAFLGAVVPLQLMAFIIVAIGMSNIVGCQTLIGLGKDTLFLKSVCMGAVSNFLLNLVLIPRFGASGASFSSVFAELVVLGMCIYFTFTKTEVRISGGWDMLKSVAGSLLLIPLYFVMRRLCSGWWLVGAYCLTGFAGYVLAEWVMGSNSFRILYDTAVSIIGKQLAKIRPTTR